MATQRQQLKKALGKKMEVMYGISYEKNIVYFNIPAYVSIDYDDRFEVDSGKLAVRIMNSKAIVTIWRDNLMMHITIFR